MFSEDDDQEQKIALSIALGVAIFVAIGTISLVGLTGKLGFSNHDSKKTATTAVSVANLKDNESAVIVENNMVKFYFASGKADLASGAKEALSEVVKGIQAGQTATISGYHDATGDPAQNIELAKQRAVNVRDILVSLGVSSDKLELKKPEQMVQDTGNHAEARRVEVLLVK